MRERGRGKPQVAKPHTVPPLLRSRSRFFPLALRVHDSPLSRRGGAPSNGALPSHGRGTRGRAPAGSLSCNPLHATGQRSHKWPEPGKKNCSPSKPLSWDHPNQGLGVSPCRKAKGHVPGHDSGNFLPRGAPRGVPFLVGLSSFPLCIFWAAEKVLHQR